MVRATFRRHERLTTTRDFRTATTRGMRYATRNFVVYIRPNDLAWRRLGVVTSRKVGSAVRRNRLKRLVREFFRREKEHLPAGTDIVVIATKECAATTLADVTGDLTRALRAPRGRRAPPALSESPA